MAVKVHLATTPLLNPRSIDTLIDTSPRKYLPNRNILIIPRRTHRVLSKICKTFCEHLPPRRKETTACLIARETCSLADSIPSERRGNSKAHSVDENGRRNSWLITTCARCGRRHTAGECQWKSISPIVPTMIVVPRVSAGNDDRFLMKRTTHSIPRKESLETGHGLDG